MLARKGGITMMRRSFAALFLATLTSGMTMAEDTPTYLDVFVARVKPEKRAEFDSINKKIAALNRRNKGDFWLASESVYGENNVVTFVSLRNSLGDAQKGTELFIGALAKPGGMASAEKIFQDFNNTLVSSRSELRRRRPDLGSNASSSLAETNAVVGKARFLYTVAVHVRPGRGSEVEDLIKMVNEASATAGSKANWFVSQAAIGGQGSIYYITTLVGSLAEIDSVPPLSKTLGADGYKQFMKSIAENTFNTEFTISRFLPELSNPPEEIAAVDPSFWNPKPAPMKKQAEASKESAKK